ncbi:MAG TPA: hypothetical protein VMG99_09110 [Thermoplasmata archaeon]|nr:hypothetical protein [Thermoplasmata archaeon]
MVDFDKLADRESAELVRLVTGLESGRVEATAERLAYLRNRLSKFEGVWMIAEHEKDVWLRGMVGRLRALTEQARAPPRWGRP